MDRRDENLKPVVTAAIEAFDLAARQVGMGVTYDCRYGADLTYAWDAAIRAALKAASAPAADGNG